MNHAEQLQKKIESRKARFGRCRPGLRRLAAGRGIRARRISRHRDRYRPAKVDALNRGESYIQDIPTSVSDAAGEGGQDSGHHRFRRRHGTGHHQHLRAHAAAQDQRSGHELYRQLLPGDRQIFSSRHAGDSGIDHLSRHHR